MKNKIVDITENYATLLWFSMDACWMSGIESGAATLAILSILAHLSLFLGEAKKAAIVATNAWLGANICWMLGDVYGWETTIFKYGLLAIGICCLAYIAVTDAKELVLLRRFK